MKWSFLGAQINMSSATAAIVGPGGDYLSDREVSDEDDPDLGVDALEEDAVGGGDRAGDVETWPDNNDEEDDPRPAESTSNTGAGPSAGPFAQGGKRKRKQGAALFGRVPKKPKNPVMATRQKEAAAKVAKFDRQPKAPPMVSA